jgi:N-dimethylarginine dimethylaminohydrolase
MTRASLGPQSETGRLERVLLKAPADAYVDEARIGAQWRALGYPAAPALERAVEEHARFAAALTAAGAEIRWLRRHPDTGLDSLYARDATIATPHGLILCNMGKPARRGEPAAVAQAAAALNIPVHGAITEPGCIEGGDVVWLDARTVVVGRGYRTNDEGIRQLRALLDDTVDDFVVVPLPHWHGPGECLHLMSLLSPLDRDLCLVHSPLLPVPFREWLCGRGIALVEVDAGEYERQACNVLALAPRRCLMLDGLPRTREALVHAGCDVAVFAGAEICDKGGGGPTCLARPLSRAAD